MLARRSVGLLELFERLHLTAVRLRTRNNWPLQVCDTGGIPHFYLEELVQLVLDEDAQPYLFNSAPATEKHRRYICDYLKIERTRLAAENVFERFTRCDCAFKVGSLKRWKRCGPRLAEFDGDGD